MVAPSSEEVKDGVDPSQVALLGAVVSQGQFEDQYDEWAHCSNWRPKEVDIMVQRFPRRNGLNYLSSTNLPSRSIVWWFHSANRVDLREGLCDYARFFSGLSTINSVESFDSVTQF